MTVQRTNVEATKAFIRARVGNPYVYGGALSPTNVRQGTDCSEVWQTVLEMTLGRYQPGRQAEGATTESYRPRAMGGPIPWGGRGPFGTIIVPRWQDIPGDAAAKIAFHHGPGGGANSHMWGELDGLRIESRGGRWNGHPAGLVVGDAARPVNDPYANAWAYLPGPIVGDNDAAVVLRDAMRYPNGQSPLSLERYRELLPGVQKCLRDSDCTTVERIAMWIAQVGHESAGLYYKREIHDGSNYEGRHDLGNINPGDGRRFRGRGFIQLTGRTNYANFSRWAHQQGITPTPTWFVDHPERLETDENAFLATTYYWTVARPTINSRADARDLEGVTRLINGGLNGLADRRARYNRALAMGDQLLTILNGGGLLSALTPDEQREVLFLLRIMADRRFKSRSPFRHLESTYTDTAIGYAMGADGHGHGILTILGAEAGNPRDIALLREVASAEGDDRYPDRQDDARLARHVLDRLGLSLDDDQEQDDQGDEADDDDEEADEPRAHQCVVDHSGGNCILVAGHTDGCAMGNGECVVARGRRA